MSTDLEITLNARLRPTDRGERYEDALAAALDERRIRHDFTGGGTLLSPDREPTYCDITLTIRGDVEAAVALAVATLEKAGAPKGSRIQVEESDTREFGTTEGVAVYLNGTDLPDEVYENNDVNELIARLLGRLGTDGHMQSWWQGPRETALYLYGPSAPRIEALSRELLADFPLAQRCRIVPLSTTLPPRG
ncbi:hypothetical protein [Asanoa siamensis]|uniref:Uncharacterized protein n=1 Tax=Asanoa siamensis TaxID=926357 RepID=A0ABQ4CZR2_9ACTN|nr:hypothetical protein [Asanoa siamensis]GIF76760.1 hypothetical protein Asi02nite_62780 [Asanoa siamensis]